MVDKWSFKYLPYRQSNGEYERIIREIDPLLRPETEDKSLELFSKYKFIMSDLPFYKHWIFSGYMSLLHKALLMRCFNFADCLIDFVDVRCYDTQRSTIIAILFNYSEDKYDIITTLIKKLLSKGANINAQDHVGNTPLHCATDFCDIQIVKFLCDHGSNTSIENNDKKTPVDLAIELDKLEILTYLESLQGRLTKRAR